jgi:hypothetical protein
MLTIVKKNDSYDTITYQLENEDNSPIDLTGATVNFVMGKKNKLITNAAATITSATSGIVSYQLTQMDTLVSGTFLAEFVVTFASGTKKTYPSNGYITVDIEQNLDTSQTNVVVDMIAEQQGDFTSKLNSILLQAGNINMSAMNEYTWTATEGQLIFTFPSSAHYSSTSKWFQVSVGNVPVDSSLVNRSYTNQFALNIDSSNIKAGMTIRAMWVEPIVPVSGGHHATHEINGQDEINIANLRNYQELVAAPLAELTTTNIMDYGVVDKTGQNTTTTTQAIINAAKSGKRVIFPEGTYAINQTIVLSQFTQFESHGKVTFKILANVDVFWITSDNKISDFTIDLYSLDTYTSNVFEISSKSISTMTTKSNASYYTCIIEKINTIFSNNNTSGTNGSIFNLWAKPTDDNGIAYPTYATQFFNIKIDTIYSIGAIGYFLRNWTYNTNYYTTGSSMPVWITGVTINDVSLFGSVVYGIFDAPDITKIYDEHYRGVNPMWVTNMRLQYGARTTRFAFITTGLRIFKNCIAWDFPGSPVVFLYRTLATFISTNPYLHWDYGFGDKYAYIDVVDTNGNLVTNTVKYPYIDARLTSYVDATTPMNNFSGVVTLKNGSTLVSKNTGYKSWTTARSTNNNFIFAPSATIDGVDWDFSKNIVFNGDTGNLFAISFSENGTLLSNKYAPIMVSVPTTATSTGTAGQTAMDSNYFYVCTATNVWKRSPLTTW